MIKTIEELNIQYANLIKIQNSLGEDVNYAVWLKVSNTILYVKRQIRALNKGV